MKPLAFNKRPGVARPSRPVDRDRELKLINEAVARGKVHECPKQLAPDPSPMVNVSEFDNLVAPGPSADGAPKYGGGRWCGTRRREE